MLPQDYNLDESSPMLLEEPLFIDTAKIDVTLGLVRDENPSGKLLLTPAAVKTLVDHELTVLMQHGFSAGTPYTDMDYADVGVEFVDDFYLLASMAKTLVKFQPFENEQLDFMRYEQTIFSYFNPQRSAASTLYKYIEELLTALFQSNNVIILCRIRQSNKPNSRPKSC